MDDFTVFYPKHLLEKLEPKEFGNWEFWTHPVGNGPYRYVRQVPQAMMEFEANPEYYRGKPRIERVVLKFLTGKESALTELLSGNVQAIFYVGSQDLLKIQRDPRFLEYHSLSARHLSAILWNQRHPPFGEASVRRALTFAINRRELDQVLNLPEGIPILDVMPTERQFRRGEFPDPLPYDPEHAKRLLDEAGWHDVNGVRQRAGLFLRFTAITQPELEKAAVYIQAQLRRVGIQMDVQPVDYSILRQRVRASQFEAAMSGMPTSPVGMFGRASPIGYSNPKVVALLDKVQNTLDPDEINRIYRELMPIVQADMPVTFLTPQVESMVVARRVRGLSSPYHFDVVQYMEDLWIEE